MSIVLPRQPPTPRVISPSPDLPDHTSPRSSRSSYFSSTDIRSTNGHTAKSRTPRTTTVDISADPDYRARSRSREHDASLRKKGLISLTSVSEDASSDVNAEDSTHDKSGFLSVPNGDANGHLSPGNAVTQYWREFSRSPSPRLIPIHKEWRSFIHRHEIPRKALHVSIGFLALSLYSLSYQPQHISPLLLGFLIPVTLVEFVRHRHPPFNAFYIRTLGALMRESEAHDKYNGVIWYLLGTYLVLRFTPKDVGVVSVCLLSWCDTAASTFGRLLGRYTWRVRRGKSFAGSAAAFIFGVGTAWVFWGVVAPWSVGRGVDDSGLNAFAFTGSLALPQLVTRTLGLAATKVSGGVALGIMSVYAGLVASASEAVDLWGWDDNVTIPVLCGAGLCGFLRLFGTV